MSRQSNIYMFENFQKVFGLLEKKRKVHAQDQCREDKEDHGPSLWSGDEELSSKECQGSNDACV